MILLDQIFFLDMSIYNCEFLSNFRGLMEERTISFEAPWDKCAQNGFHKCFPNKFTHMWTDLGANVMKLSKFREEGLKYSSFKKDSTQDGRLMEFVVQEKFWSTKIDHQSL